MHIGLGETLSLFSAMTWAIGVILYRQLVRGLPPLTLNFNKNLLVLLLMLPLPWLLHGTALPSLSQREVALTLASGFLGIAVADTLYFVALSRLGASRMGIIGNAYSPLVIVLSVFVLGERLGAWQIGGFVLVMAGVAVIAQRPQPARVVVGEPVPPPDPPPDAFAPASRLSHPASIALGVVSIALMAVAIVMIKPVLEAQPLGWITLLRLTGALLGLVAIAAVRGELRLLSARGRDVNWKLLVGAAFVGQFLSMVLWLGGYKYAPASVAAVLNETASIFIVLLAWWWLREPLGKQGLVGVGLTISGVAMMLMA
ncbi:DMT family transporter [Xanthomonadaceae bacterium XH05]|nr:DMT family transporter [Xanthomonadaceae bacterium XH05]